MLSAVMASSGKSRRFRIVLPFIFCVSVPLMKFQIAVASVFPYLVVIDNEAYDESVADKIQLHGIDRARHGEEVGYVAYILVGVLLSLIHIYRSTESTIRPCESS